jgi:hypothetical protein
LEAIRRAFEEIAFVKFGGPGAERVARVAQMNEYQYNDLSADRNVVAAVQALEALLLRYAAGAPGCFVSVNRPRLGLWLHEPGRAEPECLYAKAV